MGARKKVTPNPAPVAGGQIGVFDCRNNSGRGTKGITIRNTAGSAGPIFVNAETTNTVVAGVPDDGTTNGSDLTFIENEEFAGAVGELFPRVSEIKFLHIFVPLGTNPDSILVMKD